MKTKTIKIKEVIKEEVKIKEIKIDYKIIGIYILYILFFSIYIAIYNLDSLYSYSHYISGQTNFYILGSMFFPLFFSFMIAFMYGNENNKEDIKKGELISILSFIVMVSIPLSLIPQKTENISLSNIIVKEQEIIKKDFTLNKPSENNNYCYFLQAYEKDEEKLIDLDYCIRKESFSKETIEKVKKLKKQKIKELGL